MFSLRRSSGLADSTLYNDQTFYQSFSRDLQRAHTIIVIESPFITHRRLQWLYPTLSKALQRGVKVIINTRNPECHDELMRQQAIDGIDMLQQLGATVLYTGNHHRKLSIIDNKILWEGSLNILSQSDSCEVMRRIVSPELVNQMIRFIKLAQWYTKEQI